jgi:tRNA G18 (ribose-2'-O)-methylase SpoU
LQLTHYNTNFKKRKFPIVLICDQISNAANIGSLFRTADAFGIEKLIFCGTEISLGRKMTKTSRATEKYVEYKSATSTIEVVQNLKAREYTIVSMEITSNSTAIHGLEIIKSNPIAIIIGDENFGVSEAVLKLSDYIVHINMYGENSSMNAVQAATIALYEITKQLL